MKHVMTGSAVAALLFSSLAWAAQPPASAPAAASARGGVAMKSRHAAMPKSRQEAISRLKAQQEKLEAMTDAQWQEQHAKRQQRYAALRKAREAARQAAPKQ